MGFRGKTTRTIVVVRQLLVIFLVTSVTIILAEVSMRAYDLWNEHIPFWTSAQESSLYMLDPTLGWRSKGWIEIKSQSTDALGRSYDIHYSSGPQGFRIFGDVASQKPKVLFLGDSFTHDVTVSNAKMYPALLAEMLDFEAFSLASGGWGNLQEVAAFEEARDYINPDIIIWQLCKNDFINNHYELEKRSALNNNLYRRPYLDLDNNAFMARPTDNLFLSHVMDANELVGFRSRLLAKLGLALQTIWIKQHLNHSIEHEIDPTTCRHPLLDESLRITDFIFSRMSAAARGIPVLAFGLDWPSCFDKNFQTTAIRHGFLYVTEPGEHLNTLNYKGAKNHLAADNAHWNEEGNRIVADMLRNAVEQAIRKTMLQKETCPTNRNRQTPSQQSNDASTGNNVP